MTRIEPALLATAILHAPGWVRLGITAPTQSLREQAANELALTICATIDPAPPVNRDQLPLPF